MNAQQIAQKAAELVGGDRDRQHGAKRDNFDRIADLWNSWLRIRNHWTDELTAHDVGIMMALLKVARTQSGEHNEDDYIDAAGYFACAGEIAAGDAAEARDKSEWNTDKLYVEPGDDFWNLVFAKEAKTEAKKQGPIWYEDADPLAR